MIVRNTNMSFLHWLASNLLSDFFYNWLPFLPIHYILKSYHFFSAFLLRLTLFSGSTNSFYFSEGTSLKIIISRWKLGKIHVWGLQSLPYWFWYVNILLFSTKNYDDDNLIIETTFAIRLTPMSRNINTYIIT